MQILVIEDDHDIRELISEILRSEGYTVEAACCGRDGLEILDCSSEPCLVLVDMRLPDMTGWQIIEHMKGDHRLASIPIVATTGLSKQAIEHADAILHKPYDLERLLETVREHCDAKHPPSRSSPSLDAVDLP